MVLARNEREPQRGWMGRSAPPPEFSTAIVNVNDREPARAEARGADRDQSTPSPAHRCNRMQAEDNQ